MQTYPYMSAKKVSNLIVPIKLSKIFESFAQIIFPYILLIIRDLQNVVCCRS